MRPASASIEERFLSALTSVLPATRPLVLHEPLFEGAEWTYVKECIDTGWVSSVGKFVDEFERRLAHLTGARYAVATVNGTAALHVALRLAGVGHGDEVLVPALSFVATANAVAHCGAIPHFVDASVATLGMDPDALDEYLTSIAEPSGDTVRNRCTGRRLAAIVPMHAFGHPAEIERLVEVAARFRLPLVEDAAEALGSYRHDRHAGTFGLLGVLSFNGNKVVTTGGGGAILIQDAELARQAKHLTTTAKRPHQWEFFHDQVAWNYRLPNINAALGCAQLERLDKILASKRILAEQYRDAFAGDPDIGFAEEPAGCRSNYWLNTILLRQPSLAIRDRLLDVANGEGFAVRPAWTLLNRLPMYAACPAAPLPVSSALSEAIINLPSSPGIMMGELE